MERRLGFYSWVLVLMLLVFSTHLVSAGTPNALYRVESDHLQLIAAETWVETEILNLGVLRIVRTEESVIPLDFRLGTIVSAEGVEFPRERIMVRTPYDSAWLNWRSPFDQVRFLAATDQFAELELRIQAGPLLQAGLYRGVLTSEHGEPVHFEILVPQFTEIHVEPNELNMAIPGAPGFHLVPETIQVTVRANHNRWVLSLQSAGLFSVDHSEAEPLELLFQEETDFVSLGQGLTLYGKNYGWGTILDFTVGVEVSLQNPAGNYVGMIQAAIYLED